MTSEQLKNMKELYASKRFAHFPLEIDMTKSPTILTRRSVFRAGAALVVAATATPLFTRASAWAEDARQAGAEPQNGDGFYLQDRRLPGHRDLGWPWAASDQADLRHERL